MKLLMNGSCLRRDGDVKWDAFLQSLNTCFIRISPEELHNLIRLIPNSLSFPTQTLFPCCYHHLQFLLLPPPSSASPVLFRGCYIITGSELQFHLSLHKSILGH